MPLQDYSSQKIKKGTEKQIIEMRKKFANQEIQFWKIGCFLGYNALALSSMTIFVRNYLKSNKKKTDLPLSKIKKIYGIGNLMKKGSYYGLMMSGIYIGGLILIGYYCIPINVLNKYIQLQAAQYSYSIIHNPQYQKLLVIDKMKVFNLSQKLIQQVIQQLQNNKLKEIQLQGFTQKTLNIIRQSQNNLKYDWIK